MMHPLWRALAGLSVSMSFLVAPAHTQPPQLQLWHPASRSAMAVTGVVSWDERTGDLSFPYVAGDLQLTKEHNPAGLDHVYRLPEKARNLPLRNGNTLCDDATHIQILVMGESMRLIVYSAGDTLGPRPESCAEYAFTKWGEGVEMR